MKRIIWSQFMLVVSASISGQNTPNQIYQLDIAGSLKKMEIINLSQFTTNIQYIPLETTHDLTISNINDCSFSTKNILISSSKDCWLFDMNGRLIKKIGTQGRGPGEYQSVVNARFDNKNKIYIQSLRDVLEYNQDGSFVRKYSNLFMFNNNMNQYFIEWQFYNDTLIFGHIPNNTGNMPNKALLINKTGKVIRSYRNYDIFKVANDEIRRTNDNNAHIYKFNNMLYYKSTNNDTLFVLDKQFGMVPQYVFNLGKYKEPVQERVINRKEDTRNIYLAVSQVFQTKDQLFFNCDFGDHFPAKRLTPRTINLSSGSITSWTNTRMVLGVYDRKTEKISFSKPSDTDNPLFTSGLYNDFDGGPRFFPSVQVNDFTMAMWIEASSLKAHIESNDFKKTSVLYPEKKKQLEKLATSLSDLDNPVLMIVTFKNNAL